MALADHDYASPFEGPEKLLEIWFAPSAAHVPDATSAQGGKSGLRAVSKDIWEEMLNIVKCKVLSSVEGIEMDAYLLSESSLIISPHRLILKTCGTTLNLLGLPRILEIARTYANLPTVHRCFYSRKSFMFPERQLGPHREWKDEVKFLDDIFPNGAAYTVGKVNGDHWLLWLTNPTDNGVDSAPDTPVIPAEILPASLKSTENREGCVPETNGAPSGRHHPTQDYTIEILMSHLAPEARAPFFATESADESAAPSEIARALSAAIGISDIFPAHSTTLDAYSFSPCGYSANALLKWGDGYGENTGGEGYHTIHVTPEEGWSYASFECNVPLPTRPSHQPQNIPDLKTLVRRVVDIFQPGKLTLTLFIASEDNNNVDEEAGESAVEAAQRAFKAALTVPRGIVAVPGTASVTARSQQDARAFSPTGTRSYKRTDKINYEFGGYDLAFASFELRA